MVKLVLTPSCEHRLRLLLSSSVLPPELDTELRNFLDGSVPHDDGAEPKTGTDDSDTVKEESKGGSQSAEEEKKVGREWIEHRLVAKVARQLRSQRRKLEDLNEDPSDYTLHALLRGTEVYIHPAPIRQRSPELEAILASIKLQQDRASYASMLSSSSSNSLFSLSTDRNAFLIPSSNTFSLTNHASPNEVSEAEAWRQARKQLAAMTNVLFSGFGVGFAVWYASGSAGWRLESRVAAAFAGAIVVVAAEAFLYARYLGRATEELKSGGREKWSGPAKIEVLAAG